MKLIYHFIVSLIISILLFPVFKHNVIFILVGGFLIDIDHLIWHIFKYREFNIKRAHHMNYDKSIKHRIHIFHLLEFLLICLILSLFSQIFLLISLGLIVHHIMDIYHMKKEKTLLDARIYSIFQLIII